MKKITILAGIMATIMMVSGCGGTKACVDVDIEVTSSNHWIKTEYTFTSADEDSARRLAEAKLSEFNENEYDMETDIRTDKNDNGEYVLTFITWERINVAG